MIKKLLIPALALAATSVALPAAAQSFSVSIGTTRAPALAIWLSAPAQVISSSGWAQMASTVTPSPTPGRTRVLGTDSSFS